MYKCGPDPFELSSYAYPVTQCEYNFNVEYCLFGLK